MGLTYFPPVYDDELVYSVLARWGRHVGAPNKTVLKSRLFGTQYVTPSVDLPNRLAALAARIPPERGLSVERLIRECTLFNYYTSFMPISVRAAIADEMAGNASTVRWTKTVIGRVPTLRFCVECLPAMRSKFGEMYWRRCHQLPTVLTCPDHGVSLRASKVNVGTGAQAFVAATPETLNEQCDEVVQNASPEALRLFQRLSATSVTALDGKVQSQTDRPEDYRKAFLRKGLAKSDNRANSVRLRAAVLPIVDPCRAVWPNLFDENGNCGSWLMPALRARRIQNLSTPMHLLLREMLENVPDPPNPFGEGPWPCRNRLVSHFGQLTIQTLKRVPWAPQRRIFECECGHSYTRSVLQDGTLSSPIMRTPGKAMGPLLLRLAAGELSYADVRRATGMEAKVIRVAAKHFGVALPDC